MEDIPGLQPVIMRVQGLVRPLPEGVMPPATPEVKQFMLSGEVYEVGYAVKSRLTL